MCLIAAAHKQCGDSCLHVSEEINPHEAAGIAVITKYMSYSLPFCLSFSSLPPFSLPKYLWTDI